MQTETKKGKRIYPTKTKFYKDRSGDWRWQIKKGPHIIDASTEGYKNRIDCRGNFVETYTAMSAVLVDAVVDGSIITDYKETFIKDQKNNYETH